jgi:glucan phosphoethanolaminetransferase (alkaline phosphatase superfamily)
VKERQNHKYYPLHPKIEFALLFSATFDWLVLFIFFFAKNGKFRAAFKVYYMSNNRAAKIINNYDFFEYEESVKFRVKNIKHVTNWNGGVLRKTYICLIRLKCESFHRKVWQHEGRKERSMLWTLSKCNMDMKHPLMARDDWMILEVFGYNREKTPELEERNSHKEEFP